MDSESKSYDESDDEETSEDCKNNNEKVRIRCCFRFLRCSVFVNAILTPN